MNIAILEVPHRFAAAAEQWRWIEEACTKKPACDLVLLPELALTGYVSENGNFDLTAFAEPLLGPTVERAAALARHTQCEWVVPIVEQDGNHLWNTCVWLDRTGAVVGSFRKRHPWYPETWASEHGEPSPVFVRFGLRFVGAICFDVHFLSHDWTAPADVLLFPSAWVEEIDSRGTLLPQVAREHHAWVVNANWGRGVPEVLGQGDSMIIDAQGQIVTRASTNGWLVCEITAP